MSERRVLSVGPGPLPALLAQAQAELAPALRPAEAMSEAELEAVRQLGLDRGSLAARLLATIDQERTAAAESLASTKRYVESLRCRADDGRAQVDMRILTIGRLTKELEENAAARARARPLVDAVEVARPAMKHVIKCYEQGSLPVGLDCAMLQHVIDALATYQKG